ncbi:MAG: hypothetical protein IJ646_15085 [Clostridia bacterium]|nr:hypothetical protein [Clostridia bacterium]MBR1561557.1 hypothetical protein [Clostridia bacterium]
MRTICHLDRTIFENTFGPLNTDEVVITDERILHIQRHHPMDYALFEQCAEAVITRPDIIVEDGNNPFTVLMIGRSDTANLNVVLRLSVAASDPPEHRNSVMTFFRIREKNLIKLMRRNKVLYKRG